MAKEVTIIIDGERYEFRNTKYKDVDDVCAHCALQEMCQYSSDITMCETFGVVEERSYNFQRVETDTPAQHPEYATHEELEALRRELNELKEKGTVNVEKIPLIDGQFIIDSINAKVGIVQRIKNGESLWDKKD